MPKILNDETDLRETTLHILSYLNPKELANVSLVSKGLRELAKDRSLWRGLLLRDQGIDKLETWEDPKLKYSVPYVRRIEQRQDDLIKWKDCPQALMLLLVTDKKARALVPSLNLQAQLHPLDIEHLRQMDDVTEKEPETIVNKM